MMWAPLANMGIAREQVLRQTGPEERPPVTIYYDTSDDTSGKM